MKGWIPFNKGKKWDEYQNKKRIAVAKENYIYYDGSINALIEANKRILEKKSSQKD